MTIVYGVYGCGDKEDRFINGIDDLIESAFQRGKQALNSKIKSIDFEIEKDNILYHFQVSKQLMCPLEVTVSSTLKPVKEADKKEIIYHDFYKYESNAIIYKDSEEALYRIE